MERFFEVTITDKWVEKMMDHQHGENHKQVSLTLPLQSNRITNEKYREIERTGKYYRITETGKGGKSFIFEITND